MLGLAKFDRAAAVGDDVCSVTHASSVQSRYMQISSDKQLLASLSMDPEAKRAKRGKYCVCGGPGLASCTNTYNVEGISMHKFPENEETRRQWTQFVRRHRPDFSPSNSSVICSAHFEKSCFHTRHNIGVPDELKPRARYLVPGSIPTRDTIALEQEDAPMTPRERRVVCMSMFYPVFKYFIHFALKMA